MNLPNHLSKKTSWVLVGPMGPELGLSADAVLAVDGGLKYAPKADFWVGDGDSNPALPLPEHFLKLSPEKDISDFRAALDLLPEAESILLWGFLGGRRDHELAILGECHGYLKSNPGCQIKIYNKGVLAGVFLPTGVGRIEYTGSFSLFSLESAKVTLRGDVLYSLSSPINLAPLSSHGISNKAQGMIMTESDKPLLILLGDF